MATDTYENDEPTLALAILSDNFSHSRRGDGCWRDLVWIYHRDTSSPSGFTLAAAGHYETVDRLLRQHRQTSALSPTEHV